MSKKLSHGLESKMKYASKPNSVIRLDIPHFATIYKDITEFIHYG